MTSQRNSPCCSAPQPWMNSMHLAYALPVTHSSPHASLLSIATQRGKEEKKQEKGVRLCQA